MMLVQKSYSLFFFAELLKERFSVLLFNARLNSQAYLALFDIGRGNLERDLVLLELSKCLVIIFIY